MEICLSRIVRFHPPPWATALLSQVLACLIAGMATAAELSAPSAPQQSDPPQKQAAEQDADSPKEDGAEPDGTPDAADSDADDAPQEEPAAAAHKATEGAKPKRLQFSGDVRVRVNSATSLGKVTSKQIEVPMVAPCQSKRLAS